MVSPDSRDTACPLDDDVSLREALKSLFRPVGLGVEVFGGAAAFLRFKLPDAPACLVLDVRVPGLNGRAGAGNLISGISA
jgi:FixJ family two-component response regulator